MRSFVLLALALGCRYDVGAIPRPMNSGVDAGDRTASEPARAEPVEAGGGEVAMDGVQADVGGADASADVAPEISADVAPEAPADLAPEKEPLGSGCKEGIDCGSGFCVEGLCCDRACDSTMERACFSCRVPGKLGTCSGKCMCYSSCGFWSCSAC